MSKNEPGWRHVVPPKCCQKCGKPCTRQDFEMRGGDADIEFLARQYCTWCKECYSEFLDEGEQT